MTASARTISGLPPEVRAEAAAWIARLHGPQRSAELEEGFRAWLEADPQNALAFEGMTEVWEAVAGARAGRFPRINTPVRRIAPDLSRKLALAAALTGIVASSLVAYSLLHDPIYSTAVGKQRTVELKDGSRISLNSGTRVIVAYRRSARQIVLERGEAFFEVAANPARPFSVTAGDHRVTALGTAFIVRHESGSTAVTLMEGKVAVAPIALQASSTPSDESVRAGSSMGSQGVVTLTPGERLTITAKRTEQVDKPAIDAVTAWRRGEVVLDHTPLADAAAEMNRYDEISIVIADPRLANIRISGNYKAGDVAGFAHAVAAMYGLEAIRQNGRIYLREPGR